MHVAHQDAEIQQQLFGGDDTTAADEEPRFSTEEEMKEWFWEQHKEEIMASLNKTTNRHPPSSSSSSVPLLPEKDEQMLELESNRKSLKLLEAISRVQRQFMQQAGPREVFGNLLACLLELTGSEYGFIGEIKLEGPKNNETKYLQTHAITNIAWNEATQQFYAQNVHSGLKFYNLDTLFGHVIVNAETVISNDPSQDARAGGIPPGHPPLNHFLGIPFFEKSGSKMNGMVGIANKPGGYSQQDVDFLEPFVMTCANLIQAYAALRENKHLIDTLEEKVVERTSELELANRQLEEANRRVTEASAAQLKHFACMSHEIRTPLNCIVGVSSLMQESQHLLTPEQADSVRMISTSGELLLTVVNDVLDYSKLVSGNVEINVVTTRLQETLDAVVHAMELKAQDRQVSIVTRYDPRIPLTIQTDNRRLQQILYNLLGNALKFSRDKGVIELGVHLVDVEDDSADDRNEKDETKEHDSSSSSTPTTTTTTTTNIETTTEGTNTRGRELLRFVVKDDGKGIDKSDYGKIFQPFLQARNDTEQFYGGTGLGLPITAKLVAGLGGSVSVDSKVGEWSKFTVDFPFDGPLANVADSSARLSNTHILHVCNDNPPFEAKNDIMDLYKLHVTNMKSCDELATLTSSNGADDTDQGCSYACLIHEDLYDAQAFNAFAEAVAPNTAVLLTCGPKYSVKEAHGHYRSLNKMIPSVLVDSIAFHIERVSAAALANKDDKPSATDTSAPKANAPRTAPRSDDIQDVEDASESSYSSSMSVPSHLLTNTSPANEASSSPTKSSPTIAAKSERSSSATPASPSKKELPKKSNSLDEALAPMNQNKTMSDLRVLVVEDNLINQKVMVRMLERLLGRKDNIDVVDNGQKAVDRTAEEWYDICLMDQQMPVMDGLTASRIILKRLEQRIVPPTIAIVSAHVGDYWEGVFASAGVKHFIPKPCKVDHIRDFLHSYCENTGIPIPGSPPSTPGRPQKAATSSSITVES